MTTAENTVLLLGAVALGVLFLTGRRQAAATAAELPALPDAPDVWDTPFYLRNNVPMTDWREGAFVSPQAPAGSWSIAAVAQAGSVHA